MPYYERGPVRIRYEEAGKTRRFAVTIGPAVYVNLSSGLAGETLVAVDTSRARILSSGA